MKYNIIQKVFKLNDSLAITIPASLAAGLDIKPGDWLDVSIETTKTNSQEKAKKIVGGAGGDEDAENNT